MGYEPPSFEKLCEETDQLEGVFNKFASRYFVASYSDLCSIAETLKDEYCKNVKKKTSWVFTPIPKELRLSQIACISQLKNDLKPRTEAEVKKAVSILMGAFMYRLLRLEHEQINLYEFFKAARIEDYFNITIVNSCALHTTLREALIKKGNVFDAQTVAVCCGAYKQYLMQEGVSDRYTYIKGDADFFSNLDLIIAKAKLVAAPIQAQLHYVSFIQSVAKSLKKYDKEVRDGLNTLDKLLKTKLATKDSIKREEIIKCLLSLELGSGTTQYIKELLPDDLVIDEESSVNFEETMIERLTIYNQHILLGAYILPLKACQTVPYPDLDSAIREVIEGLDNTLDTKTIDLAFKGLRFFINLPGESTIKCDAWERADAMETDLLNQMKELKKENRLEFTLVV
ncbi:hypothetical protein [Legionella sp. 29fVS95]|uniref:hypothetical protein n=1 Tax=Legionella sp. 29fVS95 TaxID=3402813 RepID=UPI003AF84E1F